MPAQQVSDTSFHYREATIYGSMWQKCEDCCCNFLKNITLEPYLLLTVLGFSIGGVFNTELVVKKTCSIRFNYTDTICDNLDINNNTEAQDNVQKFTNEIKMYEQFILSIPGVVYVLLLGSWSDENGRKIPLFLPIFGSLLGCLISILNVYFYSLPPEFLMLAVVPRGIFGGLAGKDMAVWSYMSDITTEDARTSRISFAYIVIHATLPLGFYAGTFVYDYIFGFYGIFGIQAGIYVITILYVSFCITNVVPRMGRRPNSSQSLHEAATQGSGWFCCWDGFKISNIKKTLMKVSRERQHWDRAQVMVLIFCNCLLLTIVDLKSFQYLYLRKKLAWDYHEYNSFILYTFPIEFVGVAVVLPILSRRLRVDDRVLCVIGGVAFSIHFLIIGLLQEWWHVYLAAIFTLFSVMVAVASRGALSKIVQPDETGSVFAVIAVGESIVPMVTSPFFTFLYNEWIDVYPGLIYLVGSGIYLFMTICFAFLVFINRKKTDYSRI